MASVVPVDDPRHDETADNLRNGGPDDAQGAPAARRAQANRMLRRAMPGSIALALALRWVFREWASGALTAWVLATVGVSVIAHVALGRGATNGRRRTGTSDWVAVALVAVCWGALPLVVDLGHGGARGSTVALVVPVGLAGLAVPLCASSRAYFEIALAGLLIPPAVWLLADAPRRPSLTIVLVGFAAALVAGHRSIHADLTRPPLALQRAGRVDDAGRAVATDRSPTHDQDAPTGAESSQRLDHQTRHDPLTGLLNRRGLLAELDASLADIEQRGGHVAVLIVDVDRFKVINDSLGHAAGDHLLGLIGARLSELFPTPVALGRLGGDEFVVVRRLVGDGPETAITEMARTVRTAFEPPFKVDDQEIAVTCSIGIVHGPGQAEVGRDLLRFADAALHRAKAEGKNRYELFDERLRSALAAQVDEEQALRVALERREIVPWYQPIVDARTRRIVGAELLARWIPPDGPAVRAGSFITMMHEVGLIERFSEQVIEQGLADLARWLDRGLAGEFRLSVNLPPRYVSRSGRVEALRELLRSSPCEHLTAEVTETSVVDDLDIAAERLEELRSFGMTIVLDDFGTGSASLSLLQRVPLDGVKIDRSFITNLTTDDHDRALVDGFLKLAASIDLSVTAEGVETPDQVKALLALGCRRQQGYLHGTAMTADDLYAALPHRPKRGARAGA